MLFARPWGALVNRSEELFQLVKIVTAALLVLEALYRQLGYGKLPWIKDLYASRSDVPINRTIVVDAQEAFRSVIRRDLDVVVYLAVMLERVKTCTANARKDALVYGRLGNRSPLSVICSAGGYTAPIVFEDDVYSLVFSAARASESLRHVDYEVVVDFAVINSRRRGAGRPHTLGYGKLPSEND